MKPTPLACIGFLLLFTLLSSLGCSTVPAYKQVRLSTPALEFADNAVDKYETALLGTLEPGTAVSGGSVASGCTSCR